LAVCRWGTDPALWEELAAMGEIDSLPPHFDDWYLPRVAAGEPMPEGPLHFDDSPEGDSEAPVEDIAAADKVEYRYCAYVDGKLVFTRDNISVFASDHDVFVQGGHAPTGINFLGDISESFFNDRFVYDPSATFAVLAGDESYLQDVPYEEFIAYVQEYSAAYGHNYMPVRLWIRENLVVYRIEEVYAADK